MASNNTISIEPSLKRKNRTIIKHQTNRTAIYRADLGEWPPCGGVYVRSRACEGEAGGRAAGR